MIDLHQGIGVGPALRWALLLQSHCQQRDPGHRFGPMAPQRQRRLLAEYVIRLDFEDLDQSRHGNRGTTRPIIFGKDDPAESSDGRLANSGRPRQVTPLQQ